MAKQKDDPRRKLYFMKAPRGTGYHAGRVYDVPVEKAKNYVAGGFARDPEKTLPKDMPYRKELIAAGLETLEDVKNASDIKDVKGVGEKAEQEIAEYIKNS